MPVSARRAVMERLVLVQAQVLAQGLVQALVLVMRRRRSKVAFVPLRWFNGVVC